MGRLNLSLLALFAFIVAYIYTFNRAAIDIPIELKSEKVSVQQYFNEQRKYLGGGLLEYVSFPVQQDEGSEKTHERHGILYLHPNPRGIVLVCHGFMCDKFDVSFMRRTLFSNYHVMMFDFRAHGENVDGEQCCTFGKDEAFDVAGAVSYLKSREEFDDLPRIVYGFSMGAVAAIQAQASDSSLFHAMILDCPYDKSENVIKNSIEKLRFNIFGYTFELPGRQLLEKFAFNYYVQAFLKGLLKTVANMDALSTRTHIYPLSPVDSMKKITIPCLIIHCKNDDKVPVSAAKKLYQVAEGYKRLWITNGRRHFDSVFYNPEKYIYKVNKFIATVLGQRVCRKLQSKVYNEQKL